MRASLKICVYCGKDETHGEFNTEHFIPKCFWAKGKRPNQTKTVLAHKACNSAKKDNDEYLRDVIVMSQAADSHPMAKLVKKTVIQNKIKYRPNTIARMVGRPMLVQNVTPSGLYLGHGLAFEADRSKINASLSNMAKGIFAFIKKVPLATDSIIQVFSERELRHPLNKTLMDLTGEPQSFGDSVFQCRYVTDQDDPNFMFVMIRLYECFTAGVLTMSEETYRRTLHLSNPDGSVTSIFQGQDSLSDPKQMNY